MSLETNDHSQTTTTNGTFAAMEILHSICEEVEKGNLVEKRGHLEMLLQQTPSKWFHLGTDHDLQRKRYQEFGELCIKVVLLLIKQTKISLASCQEADAGGDHGIKFKEHASLAHAAMAIVSLLLSKLRPNPKENSSVDQGRVESVRSSEGHGEQEEENDSDIAQCSPLSDGHQVRHQDGQHKLPRLDDAFQDSQQNRTTVGPISLGSFPTIFRVNEGHFSIRSKDSDILGGLPHVILDESLEGQIDDRESEEEGQCSDRLLRGVMKATIGPSIVLCSLHAQKHPWTSKASRQAANALLTQLTRICGCNSIRTLLSGCHNETQQHDGLSLRRLIPKGAFGLAIVELKQQLTRSDWKKYPAAKHTFTWLLAHMKHPYVGEQLDHCLPPSLLFVDDFEMENKVLGIQCLKHIIENVDPTELRWYGRAEVIYEALYPLMYNHKPDLIDVLYPCLLATLKVVEKDPKKTDQPRKLGRYDKALQIILSNMEGEQRISVRQANARHVPSFIVAMGITILWHIKRLVRIIIAYLETSDGTVETGRIFSLRILQAVIVQAWPRMTSHCSDLMKSLLKLLLDISRGPTDISPQVRDTVRKECIECMILLKRCCGTVVEDTVNLLLGSNLKDEFLQDCLENVLEG